MQASVFTSVFLPLALAVVMLGLGLSLTADDFKRVLVYPKAVFVGLFCQTIVLPAAAFGVAHAAGLSGPLAAGLVLLAASPGGATANLFSHLAHGDVALNITLTATNGLLSLITLPFIVNLGLEHFTNEGQVIPMQFGKVIQVVIMVLTPVLIGMAIRKWKPTAAQGLDKPVRILSSIFLAIVIGATVYSERANMAGYFQQVGIAALAFNLVSMTVGFFVPRLVGISERQAVAIGMEIGIHNGTLAIAIASGPTLLNNPTMSIAPAIYSLLMFATAAGFSIIMGKRLSVQEAG